MILGVSFAFKQLTPHKIRDFCRSSAPGVPISWLVLGENPGYHGDFTTDST